METALVVMAAGIGSRFKEGIKQLEAVGPNGEVLLEYAVHDAIEAGFNKVIFVIRQELEAGFHQKLGSSIERKIKVEYAYQRLDELPDGFKTPESRQKPWGTGQAVLAAKSLLDCPFAVINADDYYGKDGFKKLHDFLINNQSDTGYCMAGFILGNTLSDNGAVTRGICSVNKENQVTEIIETGNIIKTATGAAVKSADKETALDATAYASMNMWGFPKSFLSVLESEFKSFLSKSINDSKAEYLLPSVVNELIQAKRAAVTVLPTDAVWYGMTYKEDTVIVRNAIKAMIDDGKYPSTLF